MASMWAHINEPRPSLPVGAFEHAAQVSAVIGRGMAIEPENRHPSAGDFARGLQTAAHEGVTAKLPEHSVARGAAAPSGAATAVMGKRRWRRALAVGAIAAVLVLALATAGYFAFDPLAEDAGDGGTAVADDTPVAQTQPQAELEPPPEPAECSRSAAEEATMDSGWADAVDTFTRVRDELAGDEYESAPPVNFDPVGGYQVMELECRDLTGDGLDEMVVGIGGGAAGRVFQWAIFQSNDVGEWNLAFHRAGSQVSTLRIRRDAVVVRTPTYAPEDPLCCPSGHRSTEVAYVDGEFQVVSRVTSEDERVIRISQDDGVSRLGEFDPWTDSSVEAWAVFGTPTSYSQTARELCPHSWSDLGLTINFANLGGRDPCGPDGRVGSIELLGNTAEQAGWHTDAGLHIGMPVREARSLYPNAVRREDYLALVSQPSPIGATGYVDVLSAKVADGQVQALVLHVGAAGE